MPDEDNVYQQDCEGYRYQDQLKWNRLKTVIVIEGALLVGFIKKDSIGFDNAMLRCMLAAGTALVVMVFILAFRDRAHACGYLDRSKDYEGPSLAAKREYSWPKWAKRLNGLTLLCSMGVLVIASNLLMFVSAASSNEAPDSDLGLAAVESGEMNRRRAMHDHRLHSSAQANRPTGRETEPAALAHTTSEAGPPDPEHLVIRKDLAIRLLGCSDLSVDDRQMLAEAAGIEIDAETRLLTEFTNDISEWLEKVKAEKTRSAEARSESAVTTEDVLAQIESLLDEVREKARLQ